jgi:hypothetical protein
MEKFNQNEKDVKPDLKHDTMEFYDETNSEEVLDPDDIGVNAEADITGEELNMIEDEPDNEAAALDAAETDRTVDEDNLPEEDWMDDIPGGDASKNESDEKRL